MGQVVKLRKQPDDTRAANGRQPKPTKANEALHPIVMSEEAFCSAALAKQAFYADESTIILNMDIRDGLQLLAAHGVIVNCVVTSPPFYGQRE